MIAYFVRRLLWLPFLLLIIAFITFALGLYGPGDPVLVMLGQHADPEAAARVRHELGLDRPFLVQYADYVWKALHGDFGESLKYRGQPVGRLVVQRLRVSIQLNMAVLVIGVAVGIPLGTVAALHRNTWLDYLVVSLAVGGISFPTFVIAPILMWLLARQFHLLPPGGWEGILSNRTIMPAMVLSTGPVAVFARQTRASMLEVIQQDYVRTARAKGLTERIVILGHVLRNALIPLFTIFGLMLGGLVTGTFITETIFGIPGIGRLGFDAFFSRDYPVIMAETLIVAIAYILANLLVDMGYSFIDPRIRYA
jgi:peptide/nickel transport system permease protein